MSSIERFGTDVAPKTNEIEDCVSDAPMSIGELRRSFGGQNPIASPMNDSPKETDRRWAVNDSYFYPAPHVANTLPSGLYRCTELHGIGPTLLKTRVDTDDLIPLPDSASAEVLDEIKTFWKLKPEFEKRGFIHKRGVLMYGPPGSGKTSTVQQLISLIIKEHGGIGLYIDSPHLASQCLQMVRRIEPERPIIALMEDIDALVQRFGESEYLSLLDGESQVSNIVFVATTNYPEKLDRRFVDRPSRFDLLKEIGMPSAEARAAYLRHKEPSLTEEEIAEWVDHTEGYSMAHLREMIILCRCFNQAVPDAVNRLNDMREGQPDSSDVDDGRPKKAFGFTAPISTNKRAMPAIKVAGQSR